jgi:hypothetical protein
MINEEKTKEIQRSKSNLGVGPELKSLNFVNKKRNLEKIINENLMLMRKLHFAEPSV